MEDIAQSPPPSRVLLVFLGDYVDRGLNSRDVLSGLAQPAFSDRAVFLRGNHEAMMLEFLADPGTGPRWIANGGLETLHSYGVDVVGIRGSQRVDEAHQSFTKIIPRSHVDFLRGTRLSFVSGDYFFCHAGVRPGVRLDSQKADDLMWIREPFVNYNRSFGKIIVHGHSPVQEPEVLTNRINIDTGAYITGNLTCIMLEADQIRFLSTGPSAKHFSTL
jgi:serine/threonine protein phosphatase 1